MQKTLCFCPISYVEIRADYDRRNNKKPEYSRKKKNVDWIKMWPIKYKRIDWLQNNLFHCEEGGEKIAVHKYIWKFNPGGDKSGKRASKYLSRN